MTPRDRVLAGLAHEPPDRVPIVIGTSNTTGIKIGAYRRLKAHLGTQDRLLMSPAMYRSVLKPVHADYIAFIRERTKARVFFHTDGDVFDLVEDFVEIGVDILNPVQTS